MDFGDRLFSVQHRASRSSPLSPSLLLLPNCLHLNWVQPAFPVIKSHSLCASQSFVCPKRQSFTMLLPLLVFLSLGLLHGIEAASKLEEPKGGGGAGKIDEIKATIEGAAAKTKVDESKIHHGLPITNIHELPFMVSLWVNNRRLCTASIISPSHILSAAHCFGLEGNFSVLAGTVDAILNQTDSVLRNVKKFHVFAEDLLGKDLAIGELDEPFTTNETRAVPVTKRGNLVNSTGYIAGWGRVDDGSAPITLQGANVTIWPNDDPKCEGVLPTEICAFGLGGENTCFGDSGGPLLFKNPKTGKYEQIGITSRGSWTCEFKGFFTPISLYCGWIEKTTGGLAKCVE